jgi:hypothetical protein
VNYVEFDVLRSFWKQKEFCDIASGWSSYSNENTKSQLTTPRKIPSDGFLCLEECISEGLQPALHLLFCMYSGQTWATDP